MFKFSTKLIVISGTGAVLFLFLFMFVKIPTWMPGISIHTAYSLGSMMAAVFGPLVGFLIQFIGHAFSDAVIFGNPWWNWIFASGISGFIFGLAYKRTGAERGELSLKGIIIFNAFQILGNLIAWLIVAPVLDILLSDRPAATVYNEGVMVAIINIISCAVFGSLLLFVWSKTMSKEDRLV